MDHLALSTSLWLAFWTAAVIVPVGVIAGRWLAWTPMKGRSAVEAVLMLPLVLPPTVLGYYLLVGLAPTSWSGSALQSISGRSWAFTFEGILLASLIVNLPFAIQPIQRAFEAIPVNLREAAWVSGLSHWQTFLRIELPLAWPGIVSALALVIAHTLGEFGVILMVGGSIPGETRTLSIAIYDSVQAMRNADAALMSAVLLAMAFLAIMIVHMTSRRRDRRHG